MEFFFSTIGLGVNQQIVVIDCYVDIIKADLRFVVREGLFIKKNIGKIPISKMAKMFDVSEFPLYSIKNGKTWKHVVI